MDRSPTHNPTLLHGRAALLQWKQSHGQDGQSYMALIPLFFISAFVIYFLLEITLIPLLTASRWVMLFGAGGFLLLYLFREKMHLDLTDGLILSIFGIAPLLMAGVLTVNYFFSIPYEETYSIRGFDNHGSSVEIHLSQEAYEDFYRIRNFHPSDVQRSRSITYYFGDGALGWQVVKGNSWILDDDR